MELIEQTKKICHSYGIIPARSRGQNFLVDKETYEKIVETAGLSKDDIVLEVGPGLGFLTESLAKKAGKVIAVELDDKLLTALRKRLAEQSIKNVEIINEDILKFLNNAKDQISNIKIVANLPYNITSIFLRKYLSGERKPKSMVLMLQKEVAERVAAQPGKMSLLSVSVQFFAEPQIIGYVTKNKFWPVPEVDSAIIKLSIREGGQPQTGTKINEKKFFQLVRIGFSSRRKMLRNNLASGYHITREEAAQKLRDAGFDEKIRAQELSLDSWLKLFGVLG
ncbi:MAG: 16S rRNA (adenine(1518)-N(6)/adenine(1519)-N(6))-dimethyltransferase RsmA [Candidatus Falkowbacteria bacterium]